jgi:RNA polymerase sigma factor (sigma-70 family)
MMQGRKSAAQEDATRGEANTELAKRRQRATWVAQHLLPHERRVRGWLARSRLPGEEIDEVMQEAYCRIAMLPAVDHIEHPVAYLYSVARNLVLRRIKRQQIVALDVVADIECVSDDSLQSPERQTESRLDYQRVLAIIAGLPERCRQVVELRKLQGWSQKEIAAHLGITEKAVEKQIWTGVRAVRQAWQQTEAEVDALISGTARPTARRGGRT